MSESVFECLSERCYLLWASQRNELPPCSRRTKGKPCPIDPDSSPRKFDGILPIFCNVPNELYGIDSLSRWGGLDVATGCSFGCRLTTQ
jgi:hypothetical protein